VFLEGLSLYFQVEGTRLAAVQVNLTIKAFPTTSLASDQTPQQETEKERKKGDDDGKR